MAEIETITLVELSLFITSIIGALVLCLKQSQSSKCDKVKICWGCIDCDRDPKFKDENNDEEKQLPTNNIPITNTIERE